LAADVPILIQLLRASIDALIAASIHSVAHPDRAKGRP
jgi:hypothetical protein